jgi:beta-lactamase class D
MRSYLPVLLLIAAPLATAAPPIDWSRHFKGIDGTFVLLDGATGRMTRYNPRRAARRFPPCSTFKIPNTAIAIETGAAPDDTFVVRYDPALKLEGRGPDGSWGRDNTLRSAFRNSVVWYYQEMARRVGSQRMAAMVRQFGYGNQDTSGPVDRFWLGAPLRISADEQGRFLERLYRGRLGLSERTTALVKDFMIADRGPGWTLNAKTGACRAEGEPVSLWYVGWVEANDRRVSYFALEMGAPDYDPLMSQRVTRTRAILKDLGLLPP